MSKFTKKCMAIRTLSDTASGLPFLILTFLNRCISVKTSLINTKLGSLGVLWISVCSFWLCGSIVANPIIYRLVPSPSRFETRQYRTRKKHSEKFGRIWEYLVCKESKGRVWRGNTDRFYNATGLRMHLGFSWMSQWRINDWRSLGSRCIKGMSGFNGSFDAPCSE